MLSIVTTSITNSTSITDDIIINVIITNSNYCYLLLIQYAQSAY